MIRSATPADNGAIAAIYNHYIMQTTVTFEEEPVTAEEMGQRVAAIQPRYPWLAYELDGMVAGYAYAGPWKVRSAYRFAVEISVYLDPRLVGKGIGTKLYTRLIEELRKLDVHAVIGGVALPNDTSVRLHEKLGFEKIAQFREVGWKMNQWVDVGYWELIL